MSVCRSRVANAASISPMGVAFFLWICVHRTPDETGAWPRRHQKHQQMRRRPSTRRNAQVGGIFVNWEERIFI